MIGSYAVGRLKLRWEGSWCRRAAAGTDCVMVAGAQEGRVHPCHGDQGTVRAPQGGGKTDLCVGEGTH